MLIRTTEELNNLQSYVSKENFTQLVWFFQNGHKIYLFLSVSELDTSPELTYDQWLYCYKRFQTGKQWAIIVHLTGNLIL